MIGGHALICSPVMPEFDRESGSRRIFDLIEMLRADGWMVTFAAQQSSGDRYARMLQQRGVAVYNGFDSQLERLIAGARLDLAILAFWQTAETVIPLLRTHSPGTRVLVDSIDLHFLRNSREIFQGLGAANRGRLLDRRFAEEMARELNVYAAADGVLTVSGKEAEWINDVSGDGGLAHMVPDAEELPLSAVPLAERKGILFLGNFHHLPNVGAAEYFCREIMPLVDPALLARHPLSIVGNAMNDSVRSLADGTDNVKMVGWVPSVMPYLERARAMVVPLRYGAGTKRKVIQALMAGLPTVTTSVGAEGLQVRDGEHLLVADDPCEFARALSRLLTDVPLCERLIARGRELVAASHGRAHARQRLAAAIARVFQRPAKEWMRLGPLDAPGGSDSYQELIRGIQDTIRAMVPAGARILMTSKGDDKLLKHDSRTAEHFPQADGGVYAGHHPADSAAAIAQLEKLRTKGAEYLVFPATGFWWLDHYVDFREHLETCAAQICKSDACIIYRLRVQPPNETAEKPLDSISEGLELLRPAIHPLVRTSSGNGHIAAKNVLVFGIYLAEQENTADDIITVLERCQRHHLTQRWVALGGSPPNEKVAAVTVREIRQRVPKFQILNELMAAEDISLYDYVLLTDDDVVLPDGFLDEFIDLQARLDFALAQPARTSNSYIDHPIVEQQQGVLARRTKFVEIGPVVSFHKSCYDMVFPFDLTAPMGWGYENIWAYRLEQCGARMGIIDAVPVDHSLRKPVANYSWGAADRERKALWARHKHLPLDDCFRVLEVIGFTESRAEEHA